MEIQGKENTMKHSLWLVILVFGCITFKSIAQEQQNIRIIDNNTISTLSVAPKTTIIDVNKTFLDNDVEIERKNGVPKLDFFGDSVGYCPIVKFASDYYIMGVFYADNPIVCTDAEDWFQAISFERYYDNILQHSKPKKIEDLYEIGWALYFGAFQLSVINKLRDDPTIRYLSEYFTVFPTFDIINRKDIRGNKCMFLGNLNVQPDAYLLIMVKGDYVNRLLFDQCMDCNFRRLNFRFPDLYYPMVQPLLTKSYIRKGQP